MDRDAERTAFAWACSYLGYKAGAKWLAYLSATATGFLYVCLLVLLGLFADLMVHRGQLPSYRELSPADKERLQDYWDAEAVRTQRVSRWEEWLKAKWSALDPAAQTAIWIQTADALLPSGKPLSTTLGELSDEERKTVEQNWDRFRQERHTAWLEELGKPWSELSSELHERAWVEYMHEALEKRISPEVAEVVQTAALQETQHGVLSLVVRSDLQGRLQTGLLGWLARWNTWMWRDTSQNLIVSPYLIGLFVLALVVVLVRAAFKLLMYAMAAQAATEATTRLRRAVYHHSFRLGTLAIRALGPSEAVTIFTRHVEAVHDALFARLTVMYREPFKFILLLLFALVVDPFLALACVLCALLVWMLGGQVTVYFRRQGQEATNRASERLTLIRESLMMMRLVKCYMMELFNQRRVERQLSKYAEAQMKSYRGAAIARMVLILLGSIAALVLLYAAGVIVLWGKVGVASLLAMATGLISLYSPLQNWLAHRKKMRRGREAAVQIHRFLERKSEVSQVVGAEFLPGIDNRIEFDNVTLREPGSGRVLLQNVTLTIPAGKKVGLVGADDLEKHAFIYLIPRLLDPTSGEIRIDEHNLRWVTLDSLRDKIGTVLLHNLVFHDTVANNIGCGAESYSLQQIVEAAKIARAHQFILKLPKGYETVIGELGHSLNAAEQYRIALARAILRDPALMIIEELDNLDEEVKPLIDDALARFLPGRTVIFLPHRVSTIRSCDKLFLLHKGRVEAAGQHKELLSQSPLYKHLHYMEFNEMTEQV